MLKSFMMIWNALIYFNLEVLKELKLFINICLSFYKKKHLF